MRVIPNFHKYLYINLSTNCMQLHKLCIQSINVNWLSLHKSWITVCKWKYVHVFMLIEKWVNAARHGNAVPSKTFPITFHHTKIGLKRIKIEQILSNLLIKSNLMVIKSHKHECNTCNAHDECKFPLF